MGPRALIWLFAVLVGAPLVGGLAERAATPGARVVLAQAPAPVPVAEPLVLRLWAQAFGQSDNSEPPVAAPRRAAAPQMGARAPEAPLARQGPVAAPVPGGPGGIRAPPRQG